MTLQMIAASLVLVQMLMAVDGYYFSGSTYSVSASNAYTLTDAFPQSCTCMENAVSKKTCSLFRCTCACDITAGVCDYGCCCDPDCGSDQLTRFEAVSTCPVSYSASNVPLCYSSVELYKINPRLPLGGQPTAEAAVAGALCISKYNYATKAEYYNTAATQDSAIFQQSKGQKAYSFGDASTATLTIDSNYDKNDSIAAFSSASSTLYPYQAGYFALPAPDFSGQCNDNNFITFENPVASASCARLVSDLSGTMCTFDLSVAKIATQYIATSADVRSSSGSATTANAIQVVVDTITFEHPTTGVKSLVTDWTTNSCSTSSITSGGNVAATCSYAVAEQAASVTNPVCKNAVKSVKYVVEHAGTAASAITKVTAHIVITDVPTDLKSSYGTTFSTATWTAKVDGFMQSFSVDFNGAFTGTAASNTVGNVVTRDRSGNPGYIMGKPVLYGTLSSSVILESIAGLTVPSPLFATSTTSNTLFPFSGGYSACPTSTTFGHTPLRFGFDMTTGCSLSLTRAAMATLCGATGSSTYTDASGFPLFFDFVDGYVGAFGNADPLDPSQWIAIKKRASAPTRAWSATAGVCTGMPSGLSYKFLVAAAGEKAFPQNKIISAEVEVIYSNWVMSVPYGDSSSTQAFPLTITASFINTDEQALTGYAPPAPPVLFKVPYDVFYPFYMSPAAPRASSSALVFIAPLVCSILMLTFATTNR